jgi:hypothetical protein
MDMEGHLLNVTNAIRFQSYSRENSLINVFSWSMDVNCNSRHVMKY